MKIGILKENDTEKRVAMLPDGVAALVKLKATVLVESGAGLDASVSDDAYKEAGATVSKRENVKKESDVLLMIHGPEKKEILGMKEGQVVVAAVNPLTNHETVKSFAESGVSMFSLDVIPRTSRAQAIQASDPAPVTFV